MSAYDPKRTCVLLTISYDHQVLADNDLALEKFCDRLAPGVVADAVDRRGKVREHKRFDASFVSDAADIFGRRVVSSHMRHEGFEFHRPPLSDLAFDVFLDRWHVHRFVYQHVRTLGHFRHCFEWCGVARKRDRTVLKIETIGQGWLYRRMLDQDRGDFDVSILCHRACC